MNRTYKIKKAAFALPRRKFLTLIDREVWLWKQKESKMWGHNTDEIMKIISDRFESTWRLAFGHK